LGSTSPDAAGFLHDNFHTNYFDGKSCVSTLEPTRRAQFLLFDRRNVPDRTTAFISRLGAAPEAVHADPIYQKYERFKVLLTNYQKAAQGSGCFSFSARTVSSELEVSLSDLEEKVRYGTIFDLYLLKTWDFELK
jgi:hypothetical protein